VLFGRFLAILLAAALMALIWATSDAVLAWVHPFIRGTVAGIVMAYAYVGFTEGWSGEP
jgi:hypothetical protein